MKYKIYRRHECSQAEGLCVIIDVLRAFTTAAFAFAAGAKEIIFVDSPEEAFKKYQIDRSLTLMGEVQGKQIEGFHFGNSPADMENISLNGQRIVQRTSEGTQGVVGCSHADQLLVSSFVIAEATIKHIQNLSPSQVSFIVTGTEDGDEDLALAEYLQARLQGKNISIAPFLERVRLSPLGKLLSDPRKPKFYAKDLELALQVDRFSFAMQVFKVNHELIAKPINVF